jgi:hypothetical protein
VCVCSALALPARTCGHGVTPAHHHPPPLKRIDPGDTNVGKKSQPIFPIYLLGQE